jgi:membrane protease YdiL (CAAX protease family)
VDVERPAAIVIGLLVAVLLVNAWLGRRRFARWLALRRQDPRVLTTFYLRLMGGTWALGLAVPITLLVSPRLDPAALGWRWPEDQGLGYALAGYLLVLIALGVRGQRRRQRAGRLRVRENVSLLLPTTTTQRWLAAGLSLSAGVVEEAIFRGLLITAGVALLGLPALAAGALSLALFSWGHVYQGRAGVIGSAVLGALFTLLYLMTGSLLLPIILHIGQDLAAFLLTPAVTSINIFKRI